MENKTYKFDYQRYKTIDELSQENQNLIELSKKAAEKAYAPYSKFRVGAALLLGNGEILTGSNQENASFPVGVCAERTVFSYAHANFPEQLKLKVAISVLDTQKDVSPCGLCRQTLLEYETIQSQPIEIMLHNQSGAVIVLPSASCLLPLHFNNDMLS